MARSLAYILNAKVGLKFSQIEIKHLNLAKEF